MTAPRDVAATLARPQLAPSLDGRPWFDKPARPTSGSAEARSRTRRDTRAENQSADFGNVLRSCPRAASARGFDESR